jgi:hypothetical protein
MYCDNNSVVINSTKPESVLKKKHNSIAYHCVHEAVAASTIYIVKEDQETNIAVMLTKLLSSPRLNFLCERVLFSFIVIRISLKRFLLWHFYHKFTKIKNYSCHYSMIGLRGQCKVRYRITSRNYIHAEERDCRQQTRL